MKFRIVAKDNEKCEKFLHIFRDESKKEYEKQIPKKLKKLKSLHLPSVMTEAPIYDCVYFQDKDGSFIFWNTFQVPKVISKLGWMNPFRSAVKEMEKNLSNYLKANGVDCEVKLIEG